MPIVPHPLSADTVSVRMAEGGIVLSWLPPTEYDTEAPLELDKIKSFNIYRKIEPPLDNGWSFKQSQEGWTMTGENLPPKHYNGVLRAVSDQSLLTLLSPSNLNVQADQNRFIRLKLWTQNAQQGYLAFVTTEDTRWDKNITQEFVPTVHSSFYAVHQAFNSSKLKGFPIKQSHSAAAREYIIDMRSIPAWTGPFNR